MISATVLIISSTVSYFAFAGSTDLVEISFPLTVSGTVYKETPYWIFKKIENTPQNMAKMDSGFRPLLGDMYPAKECVSSDVHSWRGTKPGCNKVEVYWNGLWNPNTNTIEFSRTKIVILDIDLGKSMTLKEQFEYIKKLEVDKSAFLDNAYVMVVNPKYYETKVLSEDKSVYLLPIKEWSEPKALSFAFNDGTNYKYYKDSSGQYYRSFNVGESVIYWEKVLKNDEYDRNVESIFTKCYRDWNCVSTVLEKYKDTISWKILGYEVENNPDEETKALTKDLSGIFDE